MVDEKTYYLEQAARCRRLAQTISDPEFARKLLAMGREYEEKATAVSSPPLVPSGVTHMACLAQKNIECRAYQLWEQAGMPQGRDQEFYLEAERQLKRSMFAANLKFPQSLSAR